MYSSDLSFYFFFNATATTEIYTLSLHDALPISNITPTIINSPVPPKNEATKYGIFNPAESISGKIAMIAKNIAPGSVILVKIKSKY